MNDEQDASDVLRGLMPFTRTLGITFDRYSPDEVWGRIEWAQELCTTGGSLHGGVIMSLADSTGAACAYLNLPQTAQGTTTVESSTKFLRGVRDGFAEARSRPLHVGRKVIVVETDVVDATDRLVARVTQTQLVLSA
jgi:uncharacterized protein (TIGR00369 family)